MKEIPPECETTAENVANRFAMGRFRTPNTNPMDGMDSKEFYEFLLEDINIVAKKRAIAFSEWIANRGYQHYKDDIWMVGLYFKRTTVDLYETFLQSQE